MPIDSKPNSDQLNQIEKQIQINEEEKDNYRQEHGSLEDFDPKVDNFKNQSMQGFNGENERESVFIERILNVVFLVYFLI